MLERGAHPGRGSTLVVGRISHLVKGRTPFEELRPKSLRRRVLESALCSIGGSGIALQRPSRSGRL